MSSKSTEVCRLCLAEEPDLEFIFSENDDKKYRETIKEYVGLELVQNEKLPSHICSNCSSALFSVVSFIEKCREVNEKLNISLNIVKKESEDNLIKEENLEIVYVKEENVDTFDDNDDDDDKKFFSDSEIEEALPAKKRRKSKLHSDKDKHESGSTKKKDKHEGGSIKKRDKHEGGSIKKRDKHEGGSIKKRDKHERGSIKKSKPTVDFLGERRTKTRHTLVGGKVCGDKIKCDTCGLLVLNAASMAAHNRTHTGERPFKCPECDKCFSLKGTMKEHFNRLHRKVDYLAASSCVCDICGKKCYKKNDLKVHMRIHTKEKPYACTYCPRGFSQMASLTEHLRGHVGERSFSCHVCGKCFVRKTGLRRHIQTHSEVRKYSCHLCAKPLKTSQALKLHLDLHTSEKAHICEVCGVSFAQKGNLKCHIQSKHSEKSGECKICKRSFSNIAEHNKKHLGITPFACTYCPKRFVGERSLRSHMKWHTETNKFPCTYKGCTVSYHTNRQLEYHVLKVHEKVAPFACKLCSRAYYRESDLKQHRLTSCKVIADANESDGVLVISNLASSN